MRILKQLLKEFWLPAIVATFWSLFNLIYEGDGHWSLVKIVNVFGPTFFLISWLTAQYFRVSRQARVEHNLTSIESKIVTLLDELEAKTNNLLGHLSGGDSFCYILLSSLARNSNIGECIVIHQGTYPLYDITARIVDTDEMRKINQYTTENLQKCEVYRKYGTLIAGHCLNSEVWNLGEGSSRNFNIFWTARNGGFIQHLKFRRVGDRWFHATKVLRGSSLIHEDIQPDYPRNENGEVDW